MPDCCQPAVYVQPHSPGPGSVRVPFSPRLDLGAGDEFTIEAWVKPGSVSAAQPILEWNSGFVTGVAIWLSDAGTLSANVRDCGLWDNPLFTSGAQVTAGAEIGGAGERISGAIAIKIARDGAAARRAKALETLMNELPNAGERNVAARLSTYQATVVNRCSVVPTPQEYADVLRYSDFDTLKDCKAISHVLLDDDVGLLTRIEGDLPDDWLVGHHWPPEYIQDRFIELGVQIANKNDAPVQILSTFEHAKGKVGSIHTRMNDGLFPEDKAQLRVLYQAKQSLMDALLSFVKNFHDESVRPFAKPLRRWATERNIPFTE